jgi:hypothetical protein
MAGLTCNAAVITYDFEDLPLGRVQSFSDSKGGVIATFTTLDPSGLDVYLNSGTFLLPPFAGQSVANGTGFPITITFSASLESASVDFGTDNLAGVSTLFTMKAYRGGPNGILLATSTTPGIFPDGPSSFPQGIGSISAPGFDTLVVSAPQPGLAIDNLTITTVPEPGYLTIFIVLTGLFCWAYRRRKSPLDFRNLT